MPVEKFSESDDKPDPPEPNEPDPDLSALSEEIDDLDTHLDELTDQVVGLQERMIDVEDQRDVQALVERLDRLEDQVSELESDVDEIGNMARVNVELVMMISRCVDAMNVEDVKKKYMIDGGAMFTE